MVSLGHNELILLSRFSPTSCKVQVQRARPLPLPHRADIPRRHPRVPYRVYGGSSGQRGTAGVLCSHSPGHYSGYSCGQLSTLFKHSHAEFFRQKKNNVFFIFIHFLILRWCRYLKLFLVEDEDQLIPHSQYHWCWWSGDARSQGISSHDIELGIPVYSTFSSRMVNTSAPWQMAFISCISHTSSNAFSSQKYFVLKNLVLMHSKFHSLVLSYRFVLVISGQHIWAWLAYGGDHCWNGLCWPQ